MLQRKNTSPYRRQVDKFSIGEGGLALSGNAGHLICLSLVDESFSRHEP
jgi:hypothetical protein